MPDARLQKTREAYRPEGCGHLNQVATRYRIWVDANGMTQREPMPQRFRVRGVNARYCTGCEQVVDAQDDAERELQLVRRAPKLST